VKENILRAEIYIIRRLGEMKNTKTLYVFAVMVCLTFFPQVVLSGVTTPAKGDHFPDIVLSVPESPADRGYLGLAEKDAFRLSDVKADLLIIEVFSMYCPYCQREAPLVNDLFDIINKRADIRDKVKIMGIGAGNSQFEVNVFKKQYNVPFPLVPDQSFAVHKAVGEVRTPYFFVLKKGSGGSNLIIYSKVGSILDPNQFLALIMNEPVLK
jgi:peroxiredoxin